MAKGGGNGKNGADIPLSAWVANPTSGIFPDFSTPIIDARRQFFTAKADISRKSRDAVATNEGRRSDERQTNEREGGAGMGGAMGVGAAAGRERARGDPCICSPLLRGVWGLGTSTANLRRGLRADGGKSAKMRYSEV